MHCLLLLLCSCILLETDGMVSLSLDQLGLGLNLEVLRLFTSLPLPYTGSTYTE